MEKTFETLLNLFIIAILTDSERWVAQRCELDVFSNDLLYEEQ